jgi:hypothetical protein
MTEPFLTDETKEKRILPLDSQILDAIQKCGFFTFLNFIKNYRPNEIAAPIERGDLGHTLLEVYYKLLKKGYEWNDAVEKATEVGREHYQKLSLDLQTSEWIVKSFHQYTDYYKFDGIKILGVEDAFSFVIYEDDELIIAYEGKIDLFAEFPGLGETVVDHKWRAMKADYIGLDNQLIGYSIAKNTNLIYINEVGLQKSYEPEKKFRRVPIPIGEGVKERWLKNTVMWAKILDHSIQNNVWPQSHLKTAPLGITQCVKCVFNKICNSESDEVMLRKIQDEFHIGERWSPHKEDGAVNGE